MKPGGRASSTRRAVCIPDMRLPASPSVSLPWSINLPYTLARIESSRRNSTFAFIMSFINYLSLLWFDRALIMQPMASPVKQKLFTNASSFRANEGTRRRTPRSTSTPRWLALGVSGGSHTDCQLSYNTPSRPAELPNCTGQPGGWAERAGRPNAACLGTNVSCRPGEAKRRTTPHPMTHQGRARTATGAPLCAAPA